MTNDDPDQSSGHAEPKHSLHRPAHPAHSHEHHKPAHEAKSLRSPRPRFLVFWLPIIIALLLIGGCVMLRSHPKQKGPPKNAPIPVSVQEVRTGNIDVILNALGIVTPVNTVTVTSRVGGELQEVRYTEGQMVRKNELLLVIDPRPYAAALTQAQGQEARDQALLKNVRIDLERYQNAFKEHAVPQQQVATAAAQVEEDEGTVKLDQGNVQAAQVNVDYTQIRSPIDGRVGLRGVDPGNIVSANGTTPLATITQLQPITVVFTLAEDALGDVIPEMHPDRPLRVQAWDRTQQTKLADGTLLTIDNQINAATGTVKARAVFPNAQNELFPNQFVNAKLYVKTLTGVDLIPTAAIQRNDTAAFVYVMQDDGTAKSRPIKVTVTDADTSAVTGVQPGEKLVTDGFDKLQDGTKVAVRQPGAKEPATPPPPADQKQAQKAGKKGKQSSGSE